MSRTAIIAIGAAVGIVWILMALAALWSAFQGLQNGRMDWMLGWGLVGVLLLLAGCAALGGTYIHQFRLREH